MKYEVGDIVEQYMFPDHTRYVKVTDKYETIENDRPGFSGHLVDESGKQTKGGVVFGYDEDVVDIVRYDQEPASVKIIRDIVRAADVSLLELHNAISRARFFIKNNGK